VITCWSAIPRIAPGRTPVRAGSLPEAWRRFAEQVKHSLANWPYTDACPTSIGEIPVSGGVPTAFPRPHRTRGWSVLHQRRIFT
jgi:hypothetical protein